ncbi:MAG: DUF6515 family protein [Polaribacter sp.]|uniref:DUF6515 family protein n=1 Tax=Polaribacter sp. TaxID=1920175 RepID=UPI0032678560
MKAMIKTMLVVAVIIGLSTDGYSQKRTNNSTKKITKTSKKNNKVKTIKRTNVVYKNQKRKVTTIRSLPKATKIIKNNNRNVYYANNSFYELNGGRYLPIVPRVGLRISRLPVGFRTINYNNRRFYTYKGVFYIQINNSYEVVNPEVGTIIYQLPSGAEKVTINKERFYEFNNILYEKIQINGTRAYEVVGMIEIN